MCGITPLFIAVLLIFSTIDFVKAGYFKLIPSFVADKPALVPWVLGARIILGLVFALSYILTYRSLSEKTKNGR